MTLSLWFAGSCASPDPRVYGAGGGSRTGTAPETGARRPLRGDFFVDAERVRERETQRRLLSRCLRVTLAMDDNTHAGNRFAMSVSAIERLHAKHVMPSTSAHHSGETTEVGDSSTDGRPYS